MNPVRLAAAGLISILCLTVNAGSAAALGEEKAFLEILRGAYDVSCTDASRLRDYYREDAEIIHDGRKSTLDETIAELKSTLSSLGEITCVYQPRIQSSRIGHDIVYLVVRETIIISSEVFGKDHIQQICTYIFLKESEGWLIAHDHCSTIQGEIVFRLGQAGRFLA